MGIASGSQSSSQRERCEHAGGRLCRDATRKGRSSWGNKNDGKGAHQRAGEAEVRVPAMVIAVCCLTVASASVAHHWQHYWLYTHWQYSYTLIRRGRDRLEHTRLCHEVIAPSVQNFLLLRSEISGGLLLSPTHNEKKTQSTSHYHTVRNELVVVCVIHQNIIAENVFYSPMLESRVPTASSGTPCIITDYFSHLSNGQMKVTLPLHRCRRVCCSPPSGARHIQRTYSTRLYLRADISTP